MSSRSVGSDGPELPRLGFVGLGNLGRHLAASLLRAGFPLTVNDRDEAAARPLVEAGAVYAGSAREVAAGSDSVFTCLPSPSAVAEVVTGESGVLAGLAPGGTWIDTGTNDRHELQRLAAIAGSQGVHCLEAPVTGGVHLAASGEITVLVGGDPDVYAAHLPAFEAIGGKVFYIGPLGSASVIKVITNMLAFIHLVGVGEALMLARRAGLDLAQSFEVIKASSGSSFVHETESQGDPERQLRHRLHDRTSPARTSDSRTSSATSSACRSSWHPWSSRRSCARESSTGARRGRRWW